MNYMSRFVMAVAFGAMAVAAQADGGEFDSNGVKIRYVTAGEGEAVVLIHGWLGDSTMWGKDAAGNAKLDATGAPGFRFIAFDCRGHGKSDKPHDTRQYGTELAEDTVRLLDHLKIKKAHLIGYSMGAFIAGKVAATHPNRVLSVIYGGQAPLIAGGPSTGSNECEVFAKAVQEGKGLGPYLLAVWPSGRPKLTLEQANGLAKVLYGGKDVQAFAASGLSLGELRVTERQLRRCKAPSLFVYGENESDTVKDSVAAAQKVVPNCVVRVIPGGDHMTTIIKPEFGASLIEFLRAHKTT